MATHASPETAFRTTSLPSGEPLPCCTTSEVSGGFEFATVSHALYGVRLSGVPVARSHSASNTSRMRDSVAFGSSPSVV